MSAEPGLEPVGGAIAYMILAHKNLDQVVRLVERLAGDRSRFVVHVDSQSAVPPDLARLEGQLGVEFAPRFRCPWGQFGLIEATLASMSLALSDPKVERLVLLSGQDYPIKPRERIEAFLLDEHPRESFVEHFRLPRAGFPGGGMGRIEDWHFNLAGKQRSIPNSRLGIRRRPPGGLHPYQGGQYWSMTREACETVTAFARSHPAVKRFFRHTHAPDELFFQTVVMNSAVAPSVTNSDLRHERWDPGEWHPAILTADDMPALEASDALFAKKFDNTVDGGHVLDLIDDKLLSSAP